MTPKGYEIPIPTREEFERNLKEAAKPDKSPPPKPEEVASQTGHIHRLGDYNAKHIHLGSLGDV